MATFTFTVGRLWTRPVRRTLQEHGYTFTEDKGFLNSQFVVTGPVESLALLRQALDRWSKEQD